VATGRTSIRRRWRCESRFWVSPQRTIGADRLPPIDILVVSHRHPDHFDLASLARVDRRADALVTPAVRAA
jgi:UDP-MurNAc hydroxylase